MSDYTIWDKDKSNHNENWLSNRTDNREVFCRPTFPKVQSGTTEDALWQTSVECCLLLDCGGFPLSTIILRWTFHRGQTIAHGVFIYVARCVYVARKNKQQIRGQFKVYLRIDFPLDLLSVETKSSLLYNVKILKKNRKLKKKFKRDFWMH